MFRKKLIIFVIVAFFTFCCAAEAEQISVSWDGGGDGIDWSDPINWEPNIVPYNTDTTSYYVSINNAHVVLNQGGTISSLDISGDVELWSASVAHIIIDGNNLFAEPPLSFVSANDSLELSDVHLSHFVALANYGSIDFQHRSMIKEDLVNYGNINSSSISNASIDGKLTNHGSVDISPSGNLDVDNGLDNYGLIGLHGGLFGTDGSISNTVNSSVTGFGVMWSAQGINNAGTIAAWGGTLSVATNGPLINTGTLQSYDLTSLQIAQYLGNTPQDFHNSGTIDIGTSGGVVFDCNLVNEPNGVIEFLGGTLAATTITQTADANFAGFGSISGDLFIDSNGIIQLTGPTNIIGDVQIGPNATLEISDGTTLITGHTTNDGTIHIKGGRIIPQGGLTNNGQIIWESGTYSNAADFNLDGQVNLKDFADFADTWLWQSGWY